jgi:hypothetical protein
MVRRAALAMTCCSWGLACGTVDPGQNFQFAEVVFDEAFYYCRVEPMLFEQRCGPGDPAVDGEGGCHANVTSFRLQNYGMPGTLVGDTECVGVTLSAGATIPDAARQNYQSAQRQMSVEPARAELLNRPTRRAAHPRQIFAPDSPQADIIREWATRYSSQ